MTGISPFLPVVAASISFQGLYPQRADSGNFGTVNWVLETSLSARLTLNFLSTAKFAAQRASRRGVALLALNETQQSIANRWIITVNRIGF
jgi:hypothetical protein